MIKIIKGTYGYMDKNGIVRPKTADDAPFELTPEQEARLVDLGVAEYVTAPEELPDLPEGVEGIPEYNVGMKADELREIAKTMGLTFKAGTTKQEIVDAMDAFLAENSEEDGVDIDSLPDIAPAEAVEE